MVNIANVLKVSWRRLIILITIVWLKDDVVVIQGDGAMSPTVVEKDPFTEVLDTANQAEDIGHYEFTAVLWQNVEMLRGVESISCLLHAFRVHDIVMFWRTHGSTELVLAQDVEMDCFSFKESQ